MKSPQYKYCMQFITFLLIISCSIPATQAGPSEAYQQTIALAAQGHDDKATVAFAALAEALPPQNNWHERMFAAQQLINMRIARQSSFPPQDRSNPYLSLASAYASNHPQRQEATTWPIAILATIFPGAGHAWQDRWHDARTAAIMVWPILLLTLWALKKRMGPVTVFFTLITLWLWSGTVFSAISLAERGNLETYLIWWQSTWQASGLPGRPW